MSKKVVRICHGRKCRERFASYILTRLEKDLELSGDADVVSIETCMCQGRCIDAPVVVYDGHVECRQNPVKASEMLRKKLQEWKKHHT